MAAEWVSDGGLAESLVDYATASPIDSHANSLVYRLPQVQKDTAVYAIRWLIKIGRGLSSALEMRKRDGGHNKVTPSEVSRAKSSRIHGPSQEFLVSKSSEDSARYGTLNQYTFLDSLTLLRMLFLPLRP